MIDKISDFKLAESVLRAISIEKGLPFTDFLLDFEGDKELGLNALYIGKTKNISHTIYKIVDEYISTMEMIGQSLFNDVKRKENFLINFASQLRELIYQDNIFHNHIDDLTLQYLYQRSLIWILMKDLICPVYNVSLKNIKIISGKNPYIDIARYYKEGDIEKNKINYPFIFVNEIDCQVVQNAFLLIEVLKLYKLGPVEIFKDILQTDLYDKFKGILKLAFEEDKKVEKFIYTLANILGINLFDFIPLRSLQGKFDTKKYAQLISPEVSSQWWYLGVLERMMDPVRGTDWSTHETLEKYHKDFWDKVEQIKQKRTKEGQEKEVPFDLLLRLKSQQTVDYKVDPTETLQALLSSNRVW